jgi:hypothetical protein
LSISYECGKTHLGGALHGVSDEGWAPTSAARFKAIIRNCPGSTGHSLRYLKEHPLETLDTISGDNLLPSIHVTGIEVLVYLSSALDQVEGSDCEQDEEQRALCSVNVAKMLVIALHGF